MDAPEACECHVPVRTPVVLKIKKGRKRKHHVVEVPASPAQAFSVDGWERRDLFTQQWGKIEAKLMKLTSSFFRKCVELLCDFVGRHSRGRRIQLRGDQQVGFNFGMLPVAMIALNSKQTQVRIANEVEEVFSSAGTDIQAVRLNGFNCASMSTLVQAFFNVLISDEMCEENGFERNHWKNMSFDEIFQLWLQSTSTDDTVDDCGQATSNYIPLVIFVFDFETVNKQTLVNLILILKEYLKCVPITLVFLLSNQLNNSIQYYLPALATDNLIIEDILPFYEPKLIPQLMKKLVVDTDVEFKLHPDLLHEVHSYFTNYEFSFSNFMTFLKSLVFDYFYNNPLSAVCETGNLKETLQTNRRLLEIFKNSLPLTEPLARDDDAYIDRLVEQFEDLLDKHGAFTFNLQLLLDLLAYAFCQTSDFFTSYCEQIKDANYNFKDDFLSELLRVKENTFQVALRKVIVKYQSDDDDELLTTLEQYQAKLVDLLQNEATEEAKQLKSIKSLGLDCDVKIVKDKLRNLSSRSEWRQSMAPKMHGKKQQLRPFEQWKLDLLQAIHDVLQRCSPAQHHRHLIDSLFYNNIDFIRQHHFVSVRNDLEGSLSGSKFRSFKNIYPNSFILYQLYRESSPVANLYDWYEQFCEEKKHNKKKMPQSELIAHFSTTLSDLDYVGLLQSSRYKADYVNRLIWF